MPRSNRKRKRTEAVSLGNALDITEKVSRFIRSAQDCPVPTKRVRQSSTDGESGGEKVQRTDDDTIEKNREFSKLRKKRAMDYPKIFVAKGRSRDDPRMATKVLSMEDIQQLVLHGLLGFHDTVPGWCQLLRVDKVAKVVLLILHGVSAECFQKNKECFTHIEQQHNVSAVIAQKEKHISLVDDLLYRPKSGVRLKYERYAVSLQKKDKNSNKIAKQSNNNSEETSKESDSRDADKPSDRDESDASADKRTKRDKMGSCPGRTHYLLSQAEYERRHFPEKGSKREKGNVKWTNHSEQVTDSSPLIAVDCEMCTTTKGTALTRVSLVNEDGETIYNSLVKPKHPIINYATRYSGITKEMLDPVTTRLKDVQKDIIALLPEDAILVGQSLENDLKALKLYHPHIIDTSRMFSSRPVSLKNLAKFYLDRNIQNSSKGHDSIEDALASLDLVKLKLAEGDWLRDYIYTDHRSRHARCPSESIFHKAGPDKVFMMVDRNSVLKGLYKEPVGSIPTSNDAETRKKALSAIQTSQFLWAQFHSYRTYLEGTTKDEQEQKVILTKLDKRVKKIYKALPEKSLLITLMLENTRGFIGRREDSKEPSQGRMFAGIKMTL